MSGLILKLRPNEELLINGVRIENGDRKTRLRIKTENAHILRLRDAITPAEATTPIKRAYYEAQLAVAGQIPKAQAVILVERALEEARDAPPRPMPDFDRLTALIDAGDFYQIMRSLAPYLINRQAAAAAPAAGANAKNEPSTTKRRAPRVLRQRKTAAVSAK